MSLSPPTHDEQNEIDALISHFGADGDRSALLRVLDAQMGVVHGRAQAITQLAGVVITVTGFSGRIIADTNVTAQILIVAGVAVVALAAFVALVFVLPIRWITADLHRPTADWVLLTLRRRNMKSRAVRIAAVVLVLGMTCYLCSIAIMLLNPEAAELKMVR